MASESTSSQQSSHLSPSSKVNLKCEDGIIALNNAVALLEHTNVLYHPMLSFLSNCCIDTAVTIQPSAIYIEYLREFWYTTEVDDETKTITFSLSSSEKPLSFTQDEFISTTGLPVDIGAIIFPDLVHKLQNGKKNKEPNICYMNADDDADKSLSRTTVQPVTQPKALTDLKTKKKQIPPSSKPKSSYKVRVILLKKQVTETQHAEETVAISDATQSAKPYNQTKSRDGDYDSDFELRFMPDNDLVFLTGFDTPDSADDNSKEELHILNTKVDQLESNISTKVNDETQSFDPLIVADALKANLLGLLSKAQKNSLPQMIKDSIRQSDLRREKPPAQEQAPVNEENTLVLHTSVEKVSEENNSDNKVSDDEPPLKKLTFLIPTPSSIPSPTPLKDPTPPRYESKGKGNTIEEPLKYIMPFLEEGGSVLKMPKFKYFFTPNEQLTNEDIMAQVKEMKRLADLKAEKEKSEESLKKS
ncbi:hypothetical protein Tco_1094266 [Tanacetum coccineum]|uniref:Uncharacterized protein n=1 Tax=Tanacetum coccineum TaxID=301880 RepID=A0ABQ5IF20_9ASTR